MALPFHRPSVDVWVGDERTGTSLYIVDQAARTRNYRAGFGGALQHQDRGGWHVLGHAGRVAGEVVANYSLMHQYRTQAGARPVLVNIYSISYMSQ